MAKILILGGGFGGLEAAENLSGALDKNHQVTLVSPSRRFTFYPALVQLAFGKTEVGDITFDVAAKMKSLGIRFVCGEALNINPQTKRVKVAGDDFTGEISYDYLVIAVGRRLATEKIGGFFEYSHHLLGTKAALKFCEAVENFTEGNILVGLCPDARLPVPVCETAFALAKKFESRMSEEKIRISVVFPASLKAAFGGANLYKDLEAAFKRHGINVLYDVPINEISPGAIHSSQKHTIKYNLLMLVPPFQGQTIIHRLGNTTADGDGYARVNGKMQVHGLENTYAVGDIVSFSGPKFAHMAVRQADVAAKNLVSELKGEKPAAEYYHEIKTIIDAGGADSIHLHYGVWDDYLFKLRQGRFWGWAKQTHEKFWISVHS